jgi:hypothetical protein
MKILVTGCPRGATSYISKFLQKCDKEIYHECVKDQPGKLEGNDGLVSWLLVPTIKNIDGIKRRKSFRIIYSHTDDIISGEKVRKKSSHVMRKPYHSRCPIPSAKYKSIYDVVFHQIRDPLKNICSMGTLRGSSYKYAKSFFPHPDGNGLKMRMHFWYYWNKLGIENSQWWYKIEDLCKHKERLCDSWKISGSKFDEAYYKTSKNTNSRGYSRRKSLSWERLKAVDEEMYLKIFEFAKELGYE